MNDGVIKLNLPDLPKDIYKNSHFDPQNPAREQWGKERDDGTGGTVSYIPERFESIKGKGNFVYYYGCPYPSKGIRPVEAIYAMTPIKRRFIDTIMLLASKQMIWPIISFFLFNRKKSRQAFLNKAVEFFNLEAEMTASPYYLDDLYCDIVREIQNFTRTFLTEMGIKEGTASKSAEITGMMFEYDNAYLYPVNDALNETTKEALLDNFPREITRLSNLVASRSRNGESNSVGNKFKKGALLLKIAWYLPKMRKAIKKAINSMDFDNCKLSQADIYHTLLYSDYNTRGFSLEERTRIYLSMYPDLSKSPPRVLIRNK